MYRLFILLIMTLIGCGGHLMEPDHDDIDPLADAIRQQPQVAAAIKLHKERQRFIDRMSEYSDGYVVGYLGCKEHGDGYRIARPTLKDLRDAFAADPAATIEAVMATWLSPGSPFYSQLMSLNKGKPCTPTGWWGRLVQQAADKSDDPTDSAFWLVERTADYLAAHPALMAAVGLIVAGGVIVATGGSGSIGLILCPMSSAVECPGGDDSR